MRKKKTNFASGDSYVVAMSHLDLIIDISLITHCNQSMLALPFSLTPFFDPKSVLIIGASRKESTFNGVVLKNLLEAQYRGKITLLHPFAESVMGIPCLASFDELRTVSKNPVNRPELAIILTSHDLLDIFDALGELKIKYILLQTDLSAKMHSDLDQEQLLAAIHEKIKKYELHVLGPSMIGIIDFHHCFTSSVIPTRSHIIQPNRPDKPGNGVSFLAQSGGLSGACGWWQPQQELPFAKIIHIGKAMDITEAEILRFLFEDPKTSLIIMYLKTFPKDYIPVLKEFYLEKPVLYKFVGKDSTLEPDFRAAGAISVENYIELFDFSKVFLWCPPPSTTAVGIIGPSSGAINLIIAEMRKQDIHLAELHDDARLMILDKVGGSTCVLGNPVDYWPPKEFVGRQICQIYYDASCALLEDDHVGALFLALEFFNEIEFDFGIFAKIRKQYPTKPIIAILIQAEREGAKRIVDIGSSLQIPVFVDEIERGVRALKCLIDFYQIKNSH